MIQDNAAAGTGAPAGVQICQRCGQVRRESALVSTAEGGWQCVEPCRKPGGRPAVGPPVLIRMPAELRAAVEARSLPGESLAATARRLLADAVAPAPFCNAPGESGARCPWADDDDQATAPVQETRTAATQAARRRVSERSSAIEGMRGILAENWRGDPVVIGPIYTDKGAREIETAIGNYIGWTVAGPVRMITKAQLPWKLSTWAS